jgi:hypothetical protein
VTAATMSEPRMAMREALGPTFCLKVILLVMSETKLGGSSSSSPSGIGGGGGGRLLLSTCKGVA